MSPGESVSDPAKKIFYILVQGSIGFSSHCDQCVLIQLPWLFSLAEVSPNDVRAFFGKFKRIPGRPLLAPGKGPYEIPAEYDNAQCINWRFDFMGEMIRRAIREACGRGDVGTVVLLYSNHGMKDNFPLKPDNFADWAEVCALRHKPFLAVLDACYSTVFAAAALESLKYPYLESAAELDLFDRHVGFITSASGICARSTAMVSEDDGLVNLFGQKDPQEQWARGFFLRSSMFFRQFNWLLAYGFPLDSTPPDAPPSLSARLAAPASDRNMNIKQFVERMNLRCFPGGHGFHASLVAAEAFESQQFSSFFSIPPLGDLKPSTLIDASRWSGITIGDVIPAARLGRLCDDVSPLEEEEEEGEERVSGSEVVLDLPPPGRCLLIPIARADDGTIRLAPAILSGTLRPETPFVKKLCTIKVPGDGEGSHSRGARGPRLLQVGHLYLEMVRRFTPAEFGEPRWQPTLDDCHAWETYLDTLKVCVPMECWTVLPRVLMFRSLFDTDQEFKDILREMRGRALARRPKFQAAYPGVQPIQDDEQVQPRETKV
jgi:hypothetical protein